MKKSEKEALRNAFEFPEPTRKSEFIAEYSMKLDKSKRSPVPVYFKYTAVAAFAVLLIGLGILHTPSRHNNFTSSELIAGTTASISTEQASASDTEVAKVTVTTPVDDIFNNDTTTETAASTTAENSTSTLASISTAAAASSASSSTITTSKATISTTKTTSHTIPTQTNSQTTVTSITVTTLAASSSEPPSIEGPVDYTVKPTIIINVPAEDPDPIENDGASHGDNIDENSPSAVVPGASSDTIVNGTILRTYYTMIDDLPYIQADLQILRVWRGDTIKAYDSISVYIPGGYFLNYRNRLDWSDPEFIPKTNEQYLIMLNIAGTDFPDNTFILSDPAEYSAFIFDDDGRYISAANSDIRFDTLDIEGFIAQ